MTEGEPASDAEPTGAALSQIAYERIRQDIFDCRYAAGERLRERDVAAALQMSRVPVREAFPRLETAGLIRMDGRRGAIVTHITTADVNELYNLRAVLEPLAARTAAERVSPRIGQMLRDALAEAGAAVDRLDYLAFDQINRELHRLIVEAADSDLLVRTLAPLDDRTARLSSVTREVGSQDRHIEHRTLIAAIADGNPALAAAASFTHVELGRARTLSALDAHPHHLVPRRSTDARRASAAEPAAPSQRTDR